MEHTLESINNLLESGKYQIIESKTLNQLISLTRQDIQKKICGAKDARFILDMSQNVFYEHIKKPECLIKPSSLKGKYVLSSVYDEAERLNKY
ncbi:hypothetical protein N1F78_11610 [Seonamhaeicola sp. MEBiC1930]|uniref:hypothetical protein n=1 Tax=Seonamhaeicola sp. MEBiC01930 TaxID=2976768 RepID=UPI00324DF463